MSQPQGAICAKARRQEAAGQTEGLKEGGVAGAGRGQAHDEPGELCREITQDGVGGGNGSGFQMSVG